MAKAKLKTAVNKASVSAFLNAVENDQKRKDAKSILKMMKDITGAKAKMWGPSIIGFGMYTYKYDSGREGDMLKVGFSPRKNALTFYVLAGFARRDELMSKLGKYTTGKSCLYIKKLEDVDVEILKELIKESWNYMTKKYG